MRFRSLALLIPGLLFTVLACSSGEGDADGGAGDADNDGLGGAPGLEDPGLGGPGDDGTGYGRASFRFGANLGHPNPNFDDATMSDLAAESGVRSIRIKYPEYHFAEWGQEIEVNDAKHYASVGMSEHAAFLIGMSAEHSTAPGGTPSWELDYWIPANLYEPIFLEDGEVNPDNYFAAYVAATMETYSPWVKYWEIWNEPDWVSDWQVTETWWDEPPTKAQLPRFNGSIFDYVRMLRIAYAVKEKVAPDTYVMTGGLGYSSFLSALLRYTDNPDGGAVSEAYPHTGAAYFDVLSFHHYPHLVEDGSSDAGLDSFSQHRDDLLAELDKAKAVGKGWMVTENGASQRAIDGVASGPAYGPNYLVKSMAWAKAEGFLGIDWFTLSDGDDASDPFANMGLYHALGSLSSVDQAEIQMNGVAYSTVSRFLAGARLDIQGTEDLNLPETARGYLFEQDEKQVHVLWARTDDDEEVAATISLPVDGARRLHALDSGASGTGVELAPVDGALQLELTGAPIFVIEP
ncbi:MAG TPA: hypothetical protein VLC09_17225 [Polyangiaceae bacterium]|nr:hypothetical protein [Polyangiaceae bacterium]